jgi:hypothetical protein
MKGQTRKSMANKFGQPLNKFRENPTPRKLGL